MQAERPAAENQNPLGTEHVTRLIPKFAIPAIIGMMVNAVYNMIDQVLIGQSIGYVGIAATNVAFPLTTIATALSLLLAMGSASNFNLRLGEGKPEKASYFAGNALSLAVIIGTVISVAVLIFLRPMLVFFGSSEYVLTMAVPYTAIIAPGLPFLIFTSVACALIRADGSPRYAMFATLVGAVFNLIFDPIVLFVLHLGIEGIAFTTTLGQVLSASIAFLYLLRHFKTVPLTVQHLRLRLEYAVAIFTLGMASFFNQLAMTVVQIVLNNTLRHYGGMSVYGSDIPIAAVGAISKVGMLFMSLPIGIAQGCQPIIGYNYGARQFGRVKQTLRVALISAAAVSVGAFLLFQIFPRQILIIFGEDGPSFIQFAVRYFRVYMFMTFVNGVQPVSSNFFTSIGKARRGILVSLTRQIIFLLPLLLILPLFLGIDGVMFAGPIADGAAFLLAGLLLSIEVRHMTTIERQEAAG